MPTLVGLHHGDVRVVDRPPRAEVNAGAAHRGVQPILLDQRDGKEIPPELKMGLNPQVSLAQCDKDCDVLDPVRV